MSTLSQGTLVNPKPDEFLTRAIEPVLCHLKDIGFNKSASQLLLATAIKESGNFKYRRQINGPALSYFQIEPQTHDDVWDNYLKYRPTLASLITRTLSTPTANKLRELETNDNYAAAIARIVYKRVPAPLPAFGNINAMASYWKQYYNTPLGKGTTAGFISIWNISTKGINLTYRDKCV